jgi:predicted DNA-binding transcriptional regulator AlpA
MGADTEARKMSDSGDLTESMEAGPALERSPLSEGILIAVTPVLVNAKALARMLGLSTSNVHKMNRTGELGPIPVKLGGRRLWRTEEISRWVMAGCPGRMKWMDSAEGQQAQGQSRRSDW